MNTNQIWYKRDLTDLQPVVRTSLSYPIEAGDSIGLNQAVILSAVLRAIVQDLSNTSEIQVTTPLAISGNFRAIVRTDNQGTSDVGLTTPSLVSGIYREMVRTGGESLSEIQLGTPTAVSGTFRFMVITHTAYDIDSIQLSIPVLLGGSFGRV